MPTGGASYGTRVLSKTGNLKAVMLTMGPKDVKTAMRYQHPEVEVVRQALNQPGGPITTGTATYLAIANKLFSEEERADIVALIAADPECGDVIRGTGGF